MEILERVYHDETPNSWQMFLEGIAVAILGTIFGFWLFPDECSLVATFLAAVATMDSIRRVLAWNKRAIQQEGMIPKRANARLAWLVLCLFMGATIGFSSIALSFPLEMVEFIFSHQIGPYTGREFPNMTFGNPQHLLFNNVYVMLFFFAVGLPFREGGVIFAVSWNASVWGSLFSVLARRWAESGGPGTLEAYFRVILACTPHMAMEAFSYVLAGFAGVFMSQVLGRYKWDNPIVVSVMRSVAAMLAVAAVLVFIGAYWEGLLAPVLVRWLS
jgi:hypothetical protein